MVKTVDTIRYIFGTLSFATGGEGSPTTVRKRESDIVRGVSQRVAYNKADGRGGIDSKGDESTVIYD